MSLEKLTTEEHPLEAQFFIQQASLAHDTLESEESSEITTALATLSIAHSLFIIAQVLTPRETTRSKE